MRSGWVFNPEKLEFMAEHECIWEAEREACERWLGIKHAPIADIRRQKQERRKQKQAARQVIVPHILSFQHGKRGSALSY